MYALIRFFQFVEEQQNGCWNWAGAVDGKAYGFFYDKKSHWKAHRWMYRFYTGVHPRKKQVCHTCDNPRCVNPGHLWLGTNFQNSIDMLHKKRSFNQLKTHCPKGHPYSVENTYYPPNVRSGLRIERQCRECRRVNQRIRRALYGRSDR